MSNLGYLIKEGFKNIFNNRMMSLAAVGVLISCLVLTGSAVMLSVNASGIVEDVGDTNVTKVFLDQDMTPPEAKAFGVKLRAVENVRDAFFIDKDEAAEQYFGDTFENRETFAKVMEDNPLPYTYDVTMEDITKYDETVDRLKAIDGVYSIGSHRELAEKVTRLSSLITMMSFWIIIVLAIISMFIVSNTIRMTMFSHRFEISIMKSVGASNHFVRVPFIIEGVVIGVVSAGISVALLALLSNLVIKAANSFLPQFNYTPFSSVMWYIIGGFLAAGVLVGVLGSWVSIRRFLKREGNEILGW